jgi:hypothetical protein
MQRIVLVGSFSLAMIACQAPAERAPLPPLPEKVKALPYAELITRARWQASQANDAFYVDKWAEVEEAARGLEDTARFLAKADEVPAKHKTTLSESARALGQEAARLRAAAVARDVKRATVAMTAIHQKVRDLRPGP